MKTTKQTKPEFTVDLTHCYTPNDIYIAFGVAKQEAGLPMTNNEFLTILSEVARVRQTIDSFTDTICKILDDGIKCECTKKPNIFKRFWNWITRKK